MVTLCDHLQTLKFSPSLPYAFTEHGALMLANVLQSEKAIQMSLAIVRAFTKLREILSTNKTLAHKLIELERKIGKHDEVIREIITAIRHLMDPPPAYAKAPAGEPAKPKPKIGFHP